MCFRRCSLLPWHWQSPRKLWGFALSFSYRLWGGSTTLGFKFARSSLLSRDYWTQGWLGRGKESLPLEFLSCSDATQISTKHLSISSANLARYLWGTGPQCWTWRKQPEVIFGLKVLLMEWAEYLTINDSTAQGPGVGRAGEIFSEMIPKQASEQIFSFKWTRVHFKRQIWVIACCDCNCRTVCSCLVLQSF